MSYSGPESSMENGGRAGNRRRRINKISGDGGGDPESWTAFADSFSQVQTVLDRNRELIQQANENHQSRIPDNMVKNVAIIQELNGNIEKVASIYSDLSTGFTAKVRQQRWRQDGGGNGKGGGKGGCSNGE